MKNLQVTSNELIEVYLCFIIRQNNFKFPASRFWIINENLLPIRDFDSSGVPHIAKFCDTMEFKEVELFNDTKEMEKIVKERLVGKINTKRHNIIQK